MLVPTTQNEHAPAPWVCQQESL